MKLTKLNDYINKNLDDRSDQSHTNHQLRLDKSQLKISKSNKSYKSFDDLIMQIKKNIKEQLVIENSSKIETLMENKPIKLDSQQLAEQILQACDIAKITDDYGLNGQLYIENPDNYIMLSDINFLEMIVANLCQKLTDQKFEIIIKIDDIVNMSNKIYNHIKNNRSVRNLVECPNYYTVTKNNFVVNLKNQSVETIENIREEFDVINKSNVNLIDYSIQSKTQQEFSILYRQVIDRIMKDWSNDDEEIEYLLWQIIYSVIQNDNHDKFIIIKGPGGNGKSTFMELLASIAGENNTVRANIHQFSDPNAINKINMQTRVIIGDDAATNHKLGENALSNLKSLTTGQRLSLPMKYKDNVIVQTRATFIQGTNTDINFFENNKALSSRMMTIEWSTKNFRASNIEKSFNLDELLQKQSFIDELFMMCLEKVDYFEEFTIPSSVIESTQSLIEANDSIKLFLDDILDVINYHKIVPAKMLYHNFIEWSKSNNPKGGIMKYQSFLKGLREKEQTFNFTLKEDRSTYKKYQFINSLIYLLNSDADLLLEKQKCISFNDYITEEDIEEFTNLNHPVKHLTDKQQQIINILLYDRNQNWIKSIYE